MKTTDHSVTERFLRYISYDTQSKEEENSKRRMRIMKKTWGKLILTAPVFRI